MHTRWSWSALTLVLLCWSPRAEAAPVSLGYGSGTLTLESLTKLPDETLRQHVVACAKGYNVERIQRGGTPVWSKTDPATDALDGVTRAERIALVAILGRQMVGSEVDVLVPTGDGAGVPVSVYWDTQAAVRFESGPVVQSLWGAPVTPEQLRAAYGIGGLIEVDAAWDATAYAVVGQALALLEPKERALIAGLPFRRAKNGGKHRALYERGDESNWITVYDSAFAFAHEMFTGPASAPRPEALTVILHELGHAIADVRFREAGMRSKAAADAYRQRLPEVNAAVDAYNQKAQELGPKVNAKGKAVLAALDDAINRAKAESDARHQEASRLVAQMHAYDRANSRGRPAELAFAQVLEPRRSPTQYGKSSAKEHFAECFSLYKTDPDAVQRVSPEAKAWFDRGEHVVISGKALE